MKKEGKFGTQKQIKNQTQNCISFCTTKKKWEGIKTNLCCELARLGGGIGWLVVRFVAGVPLDGI